MNIGGYEIDKKVIIGGVALVGVIALASAIGSGVKERKRQAYNESVAASIAAMQPQETTAPAPTLSYHDQRQLELQERYGIAPEGFEWDIQGNLVPLGSDTMSAEDVIYTFVRSISMLNIAEAQKYSSDSKIIEDYQDYYENNLDIVNYYDNFLRKQFTESMKSMEVEGISDTAVLADGTQYMTIKIKSLDLKNKDFWLADQEELFQNMRVFDETEEDDAKMEGYVYDYILQAYADGRVGKAESTVTVVVSKGGDGGWLVSNDSELGAVLEYKNGVDVAEYIMEGYEDWYRNVQIEERNAQFKNGGIQ